jgi:hypothetical protein
MMTWRTTMKAQQHITKIEQSLKELAIWKTKIDLFVSESKTPNTHINEWNKLVRAHKKAQYSASGLTWDELQTMTSEEIQTIVVKQKEYQEYLNLVSKIG